MFVCECMFGCADGCVVCFVLGGWLVVECLLAAGERRHFTPDRPRHTIHNTQDRTDGRMGRIRIVHETRVHAMNECRAAWVRELQEGTLGGS